MPRERRVLIAGAGMAGLEALLALRDLAGDRLEIDLMAATRDFVYRPLSVIEPFGHSQREHRLPLGSMLRDLGAGHLFDDLAAVDPERRRVRGTSGDEYGYDALVVAIGARAADSVPGALTFRGPDGVAGYRRLLRDLDDGRTRSLAFAVPGGVAWSLPAYELALLTAMRLFDGRTRGPRLVVITPEPEPLAAFGRSVSDEVARLLERHAIELQPRSVPVGAPAGEVLLDDGRSLLAERTVALPRLLGPQIPGLPTNDDGFVPVDEHGRVRGHDRLYAAGDVGSWPVKQGGLAAQQADAVAAAIASWAGAPVRPSPFRPVLRGVLLSGDDPVYLRADSRDGRHRSAARIQPLWWPPAKVAGRYLAPYLAARGIDVPVDSLPA
jgi:sulfide:quinone oxidoreductase